MIKGNWVLRFNCRMEYYLKREFEVVLDGAPSMEQLSRSHWASCNGVVMKDRHGRYGEKAAHYVWEEEALSRSNASLPSDTRVRLVASEDIPKGSVVLVDPETGEVRAAVKAEGAERELQAERDRKVQASKAALARLNDFSYLEERRVQAAKGIHPPFLAHYVRRAKPDAVPPPCCRLADELARLAAAPKDEPSGGSDAVDAIRYQSPGLRGTYKVSGSISGNSLPHSFPHKWRVTVDKARGQPGQVLVSLGKALEWVAIDNREPGFFQSLRDAEGAVAKSCAVERLTTPEGGKRPGPQCAHDWADYEGFTARYSYCRKCDAKGP